MTSFIDTLRNYVHDASKHSYAPYSCEQRAVLLLMSNGDWICGVRIENACYPLVIPALSSALTSAASVGRRDIVAIVFSGHMKKSEETSALHLVDPRLARLDDDVLGKPGHTYRLRQQISTQKQLSNPIDANTGISLARRAAEYAYTPESDFPVGAVVVTDGNTYFHGTNVEYSDWTQILCAERAAIASAISTGATNIKHIYISCLKSSETTPCGACRQVLYELAPESTVWLDRGEREAEYFHTHELLPKAFKLANLF